MIWKSALTVAIVCFALGMTSVEFKSTYGPKNIWNWISEWTAVLFLVSLPVAAIAFLWGR